MVAPGCQTPSPPAATADPPPPPSAPAAEAPAPEAPAPESLREIFPHVRVDVAAGLVEFDASVSPLLTPDPRAPLFYLEVIACLPDTREHETIVVARARPSHVHAAMLLIGLKPGAPGGWKLVNNQLTPIDPTGDRVQVRFALPGPSPASEPVEIDPLTWIVSAADGRTIVEHAAADITRPAPGWVFAGSRIVRPSPAPGAAAAPAAAEVYDADESGTLIGLASFGAETIAWSRTFSPDAAIDAPEWIAKLDATPPTPPIPPAGSPIIVRIRPER